MINFRGRNPNSIKLKGASIQNQLTIRQLQLQEEKEKAEKALKLVTD